MEVSLAEEEPRRKDGNASGWIVRIKKALHPEAISWNDAMQQGHGHGLTAWTHRDE